MFRYSLLLFFACVVAASAAVALPCEVPSVIIQNIDFEGNDITRERVLMVELDFNVGDTLASETLEQRLEENRKRLYNLRLFHTVSYAYSCDNGFASVAFTIQERWYLYPVPTFSLADRNFNAWWDRGDWSRVNYGITLQRRNFRGRNEDIRFRVQGGFSRRIEFAYRIPYINRNHNLGLEFGVANYSSHAIDFNTTSNQQRFLILDEDRPIRRNSVSLGVIQRESVQRQAGARVSYRQEQVLDTVRRLNPDYYLNSSIQRQAAQFELYKVINLRESFSYPLGGSYFEAIIGQTFFFKDSGTPITTIRAKYVDYMKLSDKFYYSVGGEGQVRLSKEYAYADNQAIGFRANIRGYELNVIGGQHYGIFKQTLSYELLNIKSIRIKQIKNPKFNNIPLSVYFTTFTDAGYAVDNVFYAQNPLANRLLYGGGVGLNIVTFYDFVFRFEYAINREGNRGLYIDGGFAF
ncbi:hypothetical protein C1N53_19310 [Pontibacter sp. SGAir0037]|nr:hypothetical protein C1N53_19310 [Pontibacter sp. SGAir0037]